MVADDILLNLRRGVLEFCVLGALDQGQETYAYELARHLSAGGPLLTSDGTLYPLLGRLRRSDLVSTVWQESPSGPPRRYYRITDKGRVALTEFRSLWPKFSDAVDEMIGIVE